MNLNSKKYLNIFKSQHFSKNKSISLLLIFLFAFLIILSPVSAKTFVTDSSHGIMTAPAASFTGNQLILSSITPEKSVTNYLSGQSVIVVGNLNVKGTKISARTSSLAKYWTRSNVVVLTTGKDISATYLAIKNNAPILITGKTFPSATKAEITRLKPKKIIICGSKTSIPDSSLKSLKNIQKTRVWYGSDSNTLYNVQKSYKSNIVVKAPKSLLPVAMVTWKNAKFEIASTVTVNGNTKIWSSNIATTSIAINRYARKNLPNIYLTSDNIAGKTIDKALMDKIKKAVSGSANVIIDPVSPAPNEASRSIKNAPNGIAAYIAASCPGLMYDIVTGVKTGYLRNAASDLNGVVFINYGKLNLANTNYQSRSWDDNFSNPLFAGIYTPGNYLKSSGIGLIEPRVGTSTEDQRVSKIASGLIYYAYYSNKGHLSTSNLATTSSLVARHQTNPSILASDAQKIVNGQKTSMSRAKWIYLSSQYIAGLPITNTTINMADNSNVPSSTFSGTLNRTEYRDASKRIYNYMKTNKKAPSTVTVKGKILNINDYTKMMAQIIYKHTEKRYMVFPSTVTVNGNVIDNSINYLQNLMG